MDLSCDETLLSTPSEIIHTGHFRELLHSDRQRRCRSISLRQSGARSLRNLNPECTERALVGLGSTHPEELRKHRPKVITNELNSLRAQFDIGEETARD